MLLPPSQSHCRIHCSHLHHSDVHHSDAVTRPFFRVFLFILTYHLCRRPRNRAVRQGATFARARCVPCTAGKRTTSIQDDPKNYILCIIMQAIMHFLEHGNIHAEVTATSKCNEQYNRPFTSSANVPSSSPYSSPTGAAFCRKQSAGRASIQNFRLSTVGSRAFPVAAAQIWNFLPEHIVSAPTLQSFRRYLKTIFLPIAL